MAVGELIIIAFVATFVLVMGLIASFVAWRIVGIQRAGSVAAFLLGGPIAHTLGTIELDPQRLAKSRVRVRVVDTRIGRCVGLEIEHAFPLGYRLATATFEPDAARWFSQLLRRALDGSGSGRVGELKAARVHRMVRTRVSVARGAGAPPSVTLRISSFTGLSYRTTPATLTGAQCHELLALVDAALQYVVDRGDVAPHPVS